jgi:glycosyltransferase involved in cell wall biosynthesis
MRVCMLAYAFYESDTRIMRYAQALARRGDQVDVIALRREGQAPKVVIDGVNILRLQLRQTNNGRKSSYILGSLLFFLRAMACITHRHLRTRYQLIHVHSVPDFLVFAAWLPKLTGTKLILDIHDLLPELYSSKYVTTHDSVSFRLLVLTERVSAAFADHVIAANHLWQEKLKSRSLRNGKCSVLANVPDRAIFCRQGRIRTDKKFIILYPGTLNWHQGLDLGIRAFALIKNEMPEAEFHIYGEGPCQGLLLQLIRELGLQDRVFMKKFIPTHAIARVMENADLGLVPKRKDGFGNEAFSTKIMEFMAMGVPVIVSDTRIDRYYFNDSIVKFFRAGDEHDLARSMLQLIRDPKLRYELAQCATEFVEHNHWDLRKTEYLMLVDSLVSKHEVPRFVEARAKESNHG